MTPATDSERLFVALKTEHYRNFESGAKTWELRGVNEQFNSATVTEGRRVELRRGYSTDDSLWGTITDVREFESVPAVADGIDHELILPGASREAFVESARELLSGYERFIAFRVDVDNWPWFECPECGNHVWLNGLDDASEVPGEGEHREVAHCGVCELAVIRRTP
jgi:hypothetical protein